MKLLLTTGVRHLHILQGRALVQYGCYVLQKINVLHVTVAMSGENQQLVTNEPVEFQEKLIEVRDCRKFTDQFLGIYRIYSTLTKENWRMSTCKRLDLK